MATREGLSFIFKFKTSPIYYWEKSQSLKKKSFVVPEIFLKNHRVKGDKNIPSPSQSPNRAKKLSSAKSDFLQVASCLKELKSDSKFSALNRKIHALFQA